MAVLASSWLLLTLGSAGFAQGESTDASATASAPTTAPRVVGGPVTYRVDGNRGLVYVQVLKDSGTLASGLSHNHVIRAAGLTGTVVWDADDASACRVDLSLPVHALDVDPLWLRERVGYTGRLGEADRRSIRKNMLSRSQLDAETHPDVLFRSTGCSGSEGSFEVAGELTVRGVSSQVEALMRVDADGTSLSARGGFTARTTDFGITPYTALLGALKNRDELQFSLHIEGDAG